ncbi:hypothetical protein Ciccas_008885 [Cichlidogyrus casuarinus]|uniref:Uncharacterized protein n=1 Tax=Cichlidogyrus casuarinus TaxID=1844966 RepID=A0ABD2PYL4_9PLAT
MECLEELEIPIIKRFKNYKRVFSCKKSFQEMVTAVNNLISPCSLEKATFSSIEQQNLRIFSCRRQDSKCNLSVRLVELHTNVNSNLKVYGHNILLFSSEQLEHSEECSCLSQVIEADTEINSDSRSISLGTTTDDLHPGLSRRIIPECDFDLQYPFNFHHRFGSMNRLKIWLDTFQRRHNFKYCINTQHSLAGRIYANLYCSKKGCPSTILCEDDRQGRSMVSYTPHNHSANDLSYSQRRDYLRSALDSGMTLNQIFMKLLDETRIESLDQLTSGFIPNMNSFRWPVGYNRPSREVEIAKPVSYRTSDKAHRFPYKTSFARQDPSSKLQKLDTSSIAVVVAAANDLTFSQRRDYIRSALDSGMTPNQLFMKWLYETRIESSDQLTSRLIPTMNSFKWPVKFKKPIKEVKIVNPVSYRTSDKAHRFPYKKPFVRQDPSSKLTKAQKLKRSSVAAAKKRKMHIDLAKSCENISPLHLLALRRKNLLKN